jgi:tetratricopeptide (TPR) repeat protein
LEWYHKALAGYEKAPGKEHPDTAAIYSDIAEIYDEQADYPRALEWYQKALTIYEPLAIADPDKYGKDAEATREAIEKLKGGD